MSNEPGITLSPKYGLNPTIPLCFWCGKEKDEIAFLGHIGDDSEDLEAPRSTVINYEPCPDCQHSMESGFTIMAATSNPNNATDVPMQDGVYPTGDWAVVRPDAARRIFGDSDCSMQKAFLEHSAYLMLFGQNGGE